MFLINYGQFCGGIRLSIFFDSMYYILQVIINSFAVCYQVAMPDFLLHNSQTFESAAKTSGIPVVLGQSSLTIGTSVRSSSRTAFDWQGR